MVSTLSALALFLSARLDFGVSLKDLAAAALPYEEVSIVVAISLLTWVYSHIQVIISSRNRRFMGCCYLILVHFSSFDDYLFRLSQMESPLLWSSTQIGVKSVGNWLQTYSKSSNSTSNDLSLRSPPFYSMFIYLFYLLFNQQKIGVEMLLHIFTTCFL